MLRLATFANGGRGDAEWGCVWGSLTTSVSMQSKKRPDLNAFVVTELFLLKCNLYTDPPPTVSRLLLMNAFQVMERDHLKGPILIASSNIQHI